MTKGTTTVNFGPFPGSCFAQADIIGQAGIVSGSLVEAWIRLESSAEHTADEHMVESIKVIAGNIIAGQGFSIYGFNTSEKGDTRISGNFNVAWVWD